MQQSQVINEIDYHRAQKITEMLYHMNLITFEEYERITRENRCTFTPVLVELLPAPTKKCMSTDSENSDAWREAV